MTLEERSLAVICETYGIAPERVTGRTRAKHAVVARQAWMWVLRQAGRSFPKIAAATGRADHGTAIHGVRRTHLRNRDCERTWMRNIGVLDACGIAVQVAA